MQKQHIDREWFVERLEANRKSVRGLARHLDIDPSAVSRMLSGQRRMKMEEADLIARFINSPVNEVLSHAGVAGADGGSSTLMLFATVDESGHVDKLTEQTALPQDVADRAQAAIGHHRREKVFAAQVRADRGPLAVWDDAVFVYVRPDEGIDPTSIGSLSICKTREGDKFIAKIEKARKTGEATVRFASDDAKEVALEWATPIIAIIP